MRTFSLWISTYMYIHVETEAGQRIGKGELWCQKTTKFKVEHLEALRKGKDSTSALCRYCKKFYKTSGNTSNFTTWSDRIQLQMYNSRQACQIQLICI